MAFLPLNAKVLVTPNGGSSGDWYLRVTLVDATTQYTNNDLAIGQFVFTFESTVGHMVAWRITEVNGGSPPSPFGEVNIQVEYYDPRDTPSTEPPAGPSSDSTGFICEATPNEGLFLVSPWQLNAQEQRKSSEIENLGRLFRVDQLNTEAPQQYEHIQAIPATEWTVTHNLGGFPDTVTIWIGDQNVTAPVNVVDVNSLTITFPTPVAGRAVVEL